jgi:hypothetical protein
MSHRKMNKYYLSGKIDHRQEPKRSKTFENLFNWSFKYHGCILLTSFIDRPIKKKRFYILYIERRNRNSNCMVLIIKKFSEKNKIMFHEENHRSIVCT